MHRPEFICDVPGQQFGDASDGILWQAREDESEVGLDGQFDELRRAERTATGGEFGGGTRLEAEPTGSSSTATLSRVESV